jgi:hypothetical protein
MLSIADGAAAAALPFSIDSLELASTNFLISMSLPAKYISLSDLLDHVKVLVVKHSDIKAHEYIAKAKELPYFCAISLLVFSIFKPVAVKMI